MNRSDHCKSVLVQLALMALVVAPSVAKADRESSNRAQVTASELGAYYAKSVPSDSYGTEGYTEVYRVDAEGPDKLLSRYPWFASELYLQGFSADDEVRLVRVGPWSRGSEARADHLALALYKNGELLKSYSTLDIAGSPKNVSASVSHYQVLDQRLGFRRAFGNKMVFDVSDLLGNKLTFDTDTGDLLGGAEEEIERDLYHLRNAYRELRATWYRKNRDSIAKAGQHRITIDELSALEGAILPALPEGYSYRSGTTWDPIVVEMD